MTGIEIRNWLDGELAGYPERSSGEELYRFLHRQTAPLVTTERRGLAEALAAWIELRAEPESMIAVGLSADHGLTELRPEIEQLLDDVNHGKTTFKPFLNKYYAGRLTLALARL